MMSHGNPDRIFFTTDTLPERDRFPMFCEEMFRRIVGCDIERHGSAPFRGVLDLRRAAPITVAHIAVTPAAIIRNAGHRTDGNDDIVVQLWQQGVGHLTQGRRETPVKAREGIVLDNTNIGGLCVEEACRVWVLTIPRRRIASLVPDIGHLAGTKLPGGFSFRLLFGYLERTRAHDLTENRRVAELFGDQIVDLVAFALGAEGEACEHVERGGVRAARLDEVLHGIETRLADPELSAAAVAAQVGVTPRYVHLLLEETGRTFSRHVLERRLARAVELLRDPGQSDRKISDLALEAGFADLSHFNRAFRIQFGDTPSGIRAGAALRENRR
jgi:AraC-like DNA-binding protein